jgi:hypothetical protein
LAAIGPSHLQPVRVGRHLERPLEEPVGMAPREAAAHGVAVGAEHLDVDGARQEGTQPDPAVPVCVRTQHANGSPWRAVRISSMSASASIGQRSMPAPK